MTVLRLGMRQIFLLSLGSLLFAPNFAVGHSRLIRSKSDPQSSTAKKVRPAIERCTISFALERSKNGPALVFCSLTRDNPGENSRQMFSSNGSTWRSVPALTGKGEWQFVGRSKDGKNVWALAQIISGEGPGAWSIWHSSHWGRTWTAASPKDLQSSYQFEFLDLNAKGHGRLVFLDAPEEQVNKAPEDYYIYTTDNNGQSWIKPQQPVHAKPPSPTNPWIIAVTRRDLDAQDPSSRRTFLKKLIASQPK